MFVADADTAVLCSFDIADQNYFGNNFYFIADTDTEKYYILFSNYFRYEFGQTVVGRSLMKIISQHDHVMHCPIRLDLDMCCRTPDREDSATQAVVAGYASRGTPMDLAMD